jgi:hypothetical protein
VFRAAVWFLVLVWTPRILPAYSVLTHEAIVDSAWDASITPLLRARFPGATSDQLRDAHAYAYAGCILQDMGYYPFGSKFFSDLLHYVRSGDFVVNLIGEAQNLDEYAFALGALAHYAADTQGHEIAVNHSVPIEYPKLARKYGKVVTYEDDPAAHIKVEFGFDVLQVARGSYAPKAYHDFIGFQVSREVLERAFYRTYSLHLTDVFSDLDLALGTYRHTVSSLIPNMTKVAWHLQKDNLVKATPGLTRRRFVYNLSKASYRKEWSARFEKPGAGARIRAFIIRILPKIGPLKALAFKPPTPRTDTLFMASFDRTLAEYRRLLRQAGSSQFQLANRNFDTGAPTRPAEYRLADDTYEKLAVKLAGRDPASIDAGLRRNILAYFSNLDLPFAGKKDRDDWQETVSAIEALQNTAAATGRE